MNGVGVGGGHPAQPGIPQQSAQQQSGGPLRPPNPLQPPGSAQFGGQRPLGMVNGVGVAMPPGVGPRPVAGPGRPGPSAQVAMPSNMLMRSGMPQPPQQPGVPPPPPPAPGQQQHLPQTPQLGQPPASPQKDTWTNLFFEFSSLPPPEQTAIMNAAGFPDREPTSLVNEAERVRRGCLLDYYRDIIFSFLKWYPLVPLY